MSFKLVENGSRAKIKVFGVGGGGGNAVNTMVESKIQGVDFIVGNTDLHALENSLADIKVQLGPIRSRGLGAGADPEVGREAAEESIEEIRKVLKGSDMVFITAGMGGGTGTGAAPVVARISKELGALTVAVVTKPFSFEGRSRLKAAEAGWQRLREHVDTIITIPNNRLVSLAQKGCSFKDSMKMADDVLVQAVKGITDLINLHGYINPDFADVKAVMNCAGPALMGAGLGFGENRAIEAVNMAIASPLLQDISIDGAKAVLVNISAREDSLTMADVTEATTRIQEEVHEDAKIILGVVFDPTLAEGLRVTVIATGIRQVEFAEPIPDRVNLPLRKKESVIQPLPFNGAEGISGNNNGNHPANQPAKRKPFAGPFLDEEQLDRPTFLRRNEN
ncbi:MAG: cell division protein FtsZ [Deltaproteobacteria bacterium RIFOXYD12_FULL_50_9]|nr:MAG: cell division protein FtsZ [Deltaproteobacteria bacterium RIFOXYD12_FULL_50_9]